MQSLRFYAAETIATIKTFMTYNTVLPDIDLI